MNSTNKKPYRILFLLIFYSSIINAQLCSGSLGDPILNITFGSGASPGPALNPSITNYNYIPNDCPNDGQYTIRSSTNNCYNSWHSLLGDHTGDPHGYLMMVNASFAPSDFYVQKITGLCANTTYEFAAWVMNLVRVSGQIRPDITFSIEQTDGVVLGTYTTGNIDITGVPQWRQVGFNFRTPAGIFEVVLRMRNNAPGGIGNDIALDDITFRPCGPAINTLISGGIDTIELCEGSTENFELAAVVPPFFSNPVYQWQVSMDKGNKWNDIEGANTVALNVAPRDAGNYWYRMSVAEKENIALGSCRINSKISVINVHPLPTVNAGPDKVIIKNSTAILDGIGSSSLATYAWSPFININDTSVISPVVNPSTDQTYLLSAISNVGCKATDEVFVKVISGIYIPNAFTPNNDGKNDTWRIQYLDYLPDATVKIFNRYGNLIYNTGQGMYVNWDGTYKGVMQPTGTYIYLVQMGKGSPPLKGSFSLIR